MVGPSQHSEKDSGQADECEYDDEELNALFAAGMEEEADKDEDRSTEGKGGKAEQSEYDDDELNALFAAGMEEEEANNDEAESTEGQGGTAEASEITDADIEDAWDEVMSGSDGDEEMSGLAEDDDLFGGESDDDDDITPRASTILALPQGRGVSLPQGNGGLLLPQGQGNGGLLLPQGNGGLLLPQGTGSLVAVAPQGNDAATGQGQVNTQCASTAVSALSGDFAGLATAESSPTISRDGSPTSSDVSGCSASTAATTASTAPGCSGSSTSPKRRVRSSNSPPTLPSDGVAEAAKKQKASGAAGRKRRQAAIERHAEWKRMRDAGQEVGPEPPLPKTRKRASPTPQSAPVAQWPRRSASQPSLLANIPPRFNKAQTSEEDSLAWAKAKNPALGGARKR